MPMKQSADVTEQRTSLSTC